MAKLLLTGTPGTGKTEVADILADLTGFTLIRVNEAVGEDYLDIEEGSKVVDLKRLSKKIEAIIDGNVIIEGHLAHLLEIKGSVIVLRTNPSELRMRLEKKGFSKDKVEENLEAEALDVILIESLELHHDVFEIETTGKKAQDISAVIQGILNGKNKNFRPGKISWLEEYVESKEGGKEDLVD
jgi:adenylate kinase